jgi:hypothetical protein
MKTAEPQCPDTEQSSARFMKPLVPMAAPEFERFVAVEGVRRRATLLLLRASLMY